MSVQHYLKRAMGQERTQVARKMARTPQVPLFTATAPGLTTVCGWQMNERPELASSTLALRKGDRPLPGGSSF